MVLRMESNRNCWKKTEIKGAWTHQTLMLIEYYERWYSPNIETMNDDSDEDNGEDGERLKRFTVKWSKQFLKQVRDKKLSFKRQWWNACKYAEQHIVSRNWPAPVFKSGHQTVVIKWHCSTVHCNECAQCALHMCPVCVCFSSGTVVYGIYV